MPVIGAACARTARKSASRSDAVPGHAASPAVEEIGNSARDGLRRKLPGDIGARGVAEALAQLRLGRQAAQPIGGMLDIGLGPKLSVGYENAPS